MSTSFTDICQARAIEFPNRPLLHLVKDDTTYSLTYQQLDNSAKKLAVYLQQNGYEEKHVLLYFSPGLDLLIGLLGCLYANVLPLIAPMSHTQKNHKTLNERLHASHAVALITNLKIPLATLSVDPITPLDFAHHRPEEYHKPQAIITNKPALLTYNAGISTEPRILSFTQDNLLASCQCFADHFDMAHLQKGICSWLALDQISGLCAGFFLSIYHNIPSWLLWPEQVMAKPLRWLQVMAQEKLNISIASSAGYAQCLHAIDRATIIDLDLSQWRVAIHYGDVIDPKISEQFAERLCPTGFTASCFYPAYGCNESIFLLSAKPTNTPVRRLHVSQTDLKQGRATIVPIDASDARVLESCGCVFKHHHIMIINCRDRARCKPFELGEICLSGPCIFSGYWDNASANHQCFITDQTTNRQYYCTGDLGFMDDKDELYVIGRSNDLIHFNNHLIFAQDIEAHILAQHETLGFNHVVVFTSIQGQSQRLVMIAEVADPSIFTQAISQALADSCTALLPTPVHEIMYLESGSIAKTVTGKIIRQQLQKKWALGQLRPLLTWYRSDEPGQAASQAILASKTAMQPFSDWLINWVAQKSHRSVALIETNKHLSRYGIDSLMTIELAHDINITFNEDVEPIDIWDHPNISSLIAFLFGDGHASDQHRIRKITHHKDNAKSSLSFNERYLLTQLAHSSTVPTQTLAMAVSLHGTLDLAACKASLQWLGKQHDNLRAQYQYINQQWRKEIQDSITVLFDVHDLSQNIIDDNARQEAIAKISNDFFKCTFAIDNAPLWSVRIIQCHDEQSLCLICCHPLIGDRWSLNVMMTQMANYYNALCLQKPINETKGGVFTYTDFVQWQQEMISSGALDYQKKYWQSHLEHATPITLPYDIPRPETLPIQHGIKSFHLEKTLANKIREFTRRNELSLYAVLLSSYQVLLYWFTREPNSLIRLQLANRSDMALTHVVGNIANYCLFYDSVYNKTTSIDLMTINRDKLTRHYHHQSYPYSAILDIPKKPCNVALILQESEDYMPLKFADCSATREYQYSQNSGVLDQDIVLSLEMIDAQEVILGRLHYNEQLFHAASIDKLQQKLTDILYGFIRNPNLPIATFLSPSDTK